jgi:hypothetical protein
MWVEKRPVGLSFFQKGPEAPGNNKPTAKDDKGAL